MAINLVRSYDFVNQDYLLLGFVFFKGRESNNGERMGEEKRSRAEK